MIVLEGGTDAGSMVLFDPEALPEGFDSAEEPSAVIARLDEGRRVVWLNTDGDGAYSLGLCTDGALPEALAPFARASGFGGGRIEVPGGRLVFSGVEAAFRRDDAFLRKHAHMGAGCEVPPGSYEIALYAMDYPEGFREECLSGRLSGAQRSQLALMDRLAPLGCVGVLAGLALMASLVFLGPARWKTVAMAASVALIVPSLILARLRPYREAKGVQREVNRSYPDYVATLVRAAP